MERREGGGVGLVEWKEGKIEGTYGSADVDLAGLHESAEGGGGGEGGEEEEEGEGGVHSWDCGVEGEMR